MPVPVPVLYVQYHQEGTSAIQINSPLFANSGVAYSCARSHFDHILYLGTVLYEDVHHHGHVPHSNPCACILPGITVEPKRPRQRLSQRESGAGLGRKYYILLYCSTRSPVLNCDLSQFHVLVLFDGQSTPTHRRLHHLHHPGA